MKPLAPLQPHPCIIIALELLGLDEPSTPKKRLRSALALVERELGEPAATKRFDRRLLVVGHRVFRIALIKSDGAILFRELLDIVHFQSGLIGHGVLLRGVVTLGDVAERAGIIVGPGLSEAERLRDELPEVPRVVVDPRLLREAERNELLRARHHTVPMELGYIRQLLREDSDGSWFVDYLEAFATELDEPSMYPDFLESHRRLVEQRLESSPVPSRSSRAWTWLRRYHNRLVNRRVRDEAERARLRLAAPSPLVYVFPPSAKAPG